MIDLTTYYILSNGEQCLTSTSCEAIPYDIEEHHNQRFPKGTKGGCWTWNQNWDFIYYVN